MVTTDPRAKVDESPIVISEIEVDGVRLVAAEPLKFVVEFDADVPVFDLEGPLNVYLFSETRELLRDMLEDHLEWLWRAFAVGDQSKLDGTALRLGEEMRRIFARASNAA